MNRNLVLKKLVLAALFVALDLLFTRVFCVYLMGGGERVSLQFLANAVCGWALGPWWGAGVAAVADLTGALIGSSGLAFFPGFTNVSQISFSRRFKSSSSIFASVPSFTPNSLAGITFVLLMTRQSPGCRYSKISVKCL